MLAWLKRRFEGLGRAFLDVWFYVLFGGALGLGLVRLSHVTSEPYKMIVEHLGVGLRFDFPETDLSRIIISPNRDELERYQSVFEALWSHGKELADLPSFADLVSERSRTDRIGTGRR